MADAAARKEGKKKRSNAKGKFHKIYNRIKGENDIDCILEMFKDLAAAHDNLEDKHEFYLSLFDSDDEGDDVIIKATNDDMTEIYEEFCEMRSKSKNAEREKEKPKLREAKVRSVTEANIRVKKLEAPVFNGDIREYPSFKRDYIRHLIPVYGEDPFVLKSCLSGDALKLIQGIDGDYDEMFQRLDTRYGRPEKLVDRVLNDLKKLKGISNGEDAKFITMVDTVERSWLQLKQLKMEEEMNTATMMSQVEKLMPPIQKREWALKKHRNGSDEFSKRFENLMNFLLEERFAMEYMNDDLRSITSTTRNQVNLSSCDHQELQEEGEINTLRRQLNENQQTLNRVVEGLAHVTEVLSKSSVENNSGTNKIKRCWYDNESTHTIQDCPGFTALDIGTKQELIKKRGACFCCLKLGHISRNCLGRTRCNVIENNQTCGRFHHPSIHEPKTVETLHNTINGNKNICDKSPVLLMISEVESRGIKINTLWDPGANMSLITHDAARRLGLIGKRVTLSVTKVGNITEIINSKRYLLPLSDAIGKLWEITAYGMEEVTADSNNVNLDSIAKLFKGITSETLKRPTGKVELLIGTDCCEILPIRVAQSGNLQLMKNQFGFSLRGSHPTITGSANDTKIHIVNGMETNYRDDRIEEISTTKLKDAIDYFFSTDSLGVQCNKECKNCPSGLGTYTLQEEREMAIIEKGLKYNPIYRQWMITYPWKKDPNNLPNNYKAALGRLKSTKGRLVKQGDDRLLEYDNQISDMVNRGVAEKLSDEQLKEYNGPIHYIAHHGVVKLESKSTPLRIVFDSSASFMGHVLNNYWFKGPSIINDLLGVLLRFRQRRIAAVSDISKMYNTVHLSELDQHTHRFIWNGAADEKKVDHYILKRIPFGDKPSGTIAILALKKTAEMNKEEYPEAADQIIRNSYVDDLLVSADDVKSIRKIAQDIEVILSTGGFSVKGWIFSGDINESLKDGLEDIGVNVLKILDTKEEKVLGMVWDTVKDVFRFKVRFKLSTKEADQKAEEVNEGNLESMLAKHLSRRIVLSQIARIYDPMGLITPLTLEAKILMRRLVLDLNDTNCMESKNMNWDTELSENMKTQWIKFFKKLFCIEALVFPRCIKPDISIGNPVLVVFSDASNLAYGACAYVRWQVSSFEYKSYLIASKNRIAPTKQLTIPRLELCGAVLASRLRERIQVEMDFSFFKVIHLTDSSIVRQQIQKESYGFASFVATRIGEIQSKTDPLEWWWIPTDQNIGDRVTRITSTEDVGADSEWQNGPDFLKQPIELWPIRNDNVNEVTDLPDRIGVILSSQVSIQRTELESPKFQDIPIKNYSSVHRLFRITSIIMLVAQSKSFKGVIQKISVSSIERAESEWARSSQLDLPDDWNVRFRRLGPVQLKNGLIAVGERMAKWLKHSWNRELLILLPPKNEFTLLYIRSVHYENHESVETCLAKVRSKYWIPGCRKLISRVYKGCTKCRLKNKHLVGQEMGQLPLERLQPSPAFYHCALDLFGPLTIKDTVKKRSRAKAYGVLFNCLSSRAVYIDVADGYDTDSFLLVLRRFASIRGYPKTMISDAGSQLVAANKELNSITDNWNWDKITAFSIKQGMQWKTTKSSDAPWENGCSEALIKSAKRNIVSSIGAHVLNFSEIQTVVFEVSNLLNERPIGTKTNDPNEGSYLCPNDLLLGRASTKIPSGKWDCSDNPRKRWEFIQSIINTYWKKWMRDYFFTLIFRQKWHTEKRNLQVGDVVLVQDANTIRGHWKLAQVSTANTGSDGRVRDVELRYKLQNTGKEYNGTDDRIIRRSAHRLVVILPVEEQAVNPKITSK